MAANHQRGPGGRFSCWAAHDEAEIDVIAEITPEVGTDPDLDAEPYVNDVAWRWRFDRFRLLLALPGGGDRDRSLLECITAGVRSGLGDDEIITDVLNVVALGDVPQEFWVSARRVLAAARRQFGYPAAPMGAARE